MVLDLKNEPITQEIDGQRRYYILQFIKPRMGINILAIGAYNSFDYSMGYIPIFTEGDLNWGNWKSKGEGPFSTVFCFDVLEHLINPGLFLNSLKEYITIASDVYITFPTRPSTNFWASTHFHEYDRDRFETLIDLCGYRIVKEQHVVLHRKWYRYFGIRPLVRLFFQKYTYNLYLVRLK